MQLDGITALVTGANRGLGRHFAEQLVKRGATVYGGARRPETITTPGVVPVALDITDPESVAAAARAVSGADDHHVVGHRLAVAHRLLMLLSSQTTNGWQITSTYLIDQPAKA